MSCGLSILVDGSWGPWTGRCIYPGMVCEGGHKEERRKCDRPAPQYGGRYCKGKSYGRYSCKPNSCGKLWLASFPFRYVNRIASLLNGGFHFKFQVDFAGYIDCALVKLFWLQTYHFDHCFFSAPPFFITLIFSSNPEAVWEDGFITLWLALYTLFYFQYLPI